MSNTAKFYAAHVVVNNAPHIAAVMGSQPLLASRLFTGSGAPGPATLQAGNGKYCAASGGFVVAATVAAGGSGYAVGDTYSVVGGTYGTAAVVTVDAVVGGAVTDCHVATVGNYGAYPANPVIAVPVSGSGSGMTLNLAVQPPDLYIDGAANAMWACTTAGSNSSSVWAQISGGSSGAVWL